LTTKKTLNKKTLNTVWVP